MYMTEDMKKHSSNFATQERVGTPATEMLSEDSWLQETAKGMHSTTNQVSNHYEGQSFLIT